MPSDVLLAAVPPRRLPDGEVRPMRPELLQQWLEDRGILADVQSDGDGVLAALAVPARTDREAVPVFEIVAAMRAEGLQVRLRRKGFARAIAGFRAFRPGAP